MKRIVLIAILLLIVLQVVVAGLLGTEAGSRWLIRQLLPLVPGELQIKHVRGRFLDALDLQQIRYHLDDTTVSVDSARLALRTESLWRGWLHLDQLHLDQVRIVTVTRTDSGAAPWPSSLVLPVGIRIGQGSLTSLQWSQENGATVTLLDQLHLRSLEAWHRIQLESLQFIRGTDQLLLDRSELALALPYRLNSTFRWQSQQSGLQRWLGNPHLRGSGTLRGPLAALTLQHQLDQPLRMTSNAQLERSGSAWHWQSRHEIPAALIHLDAENKLPLHETTITLGHRGEEFHVTGTSVATLPDGSPARVGAQARATTLDDLRADLTLAHADAFLQLSTLPTEEPDQRSVTLHPSSWLELAALHPELVSRLALQGQLLLISSGNAWRLATAHLEANGELRTQRLKAVVSASHDGHQGLATGELQVAGNRIEMNARADDRLLNIAARLNAGDLSALHPRLAGSLHGQLRLHGPQRQLQLDSQLQSEALQWDDLRIDSLALQSSGLGSTSPSLALKLDAMAVNFDGRTLLDTLKVEVRGDSRRHRIDGLASLRDTNMTLQLDGGLGPAWQWSGKVSAGSLRFPQQPPWQLHSPAALVVSPAGQNLDELCLHADTASLCASASLGGEGDVLTLAIDALPLSPLSGWLADNVVMEGALHQRARFHRAPNRTWQGQFSAHLDQATLLFSHQRERYRLGLDDAALDGELTDARLDTRARLVLQGHGHINAHLDVDIGDPAAPLRGELAMAVNELRWLEVLVPALREPQGMLFGELALSGSRAAPALAGELVLDNAEADVPAAGITLSGVEGSLRGDGRQLHVALQARSGPGILQAHGQLMLDHDLSPQLALTMAGERFQAVQLPEARILVDPDLILRHDNGALQVTGVVVVPEASLTPRELPAMAVRISDDEVIVGGDDTTGSTLPVSSDVQLRIGDKVHFSGFGLDARLAGNLQLRQSPGYPLSLNGDLRIVEGRYRAYGQNLAIERGLLLFQQRVDNPGLNIRAVRRIPSAQVTAGVEITGTLQAPSARLVSEPAMEESEAMAWLLTGRGLSGTSETDNAMIAQALAVYGLEKGSGLTSRVGDTLGLDEVSLGSDWETSDASLMLGKQISDRLYLRYAIGLFDAVSAVMLRYTINRRLHLEAQSGTERQSLDLIYQVER